ncbi:MAG TPA: FliM/FliN family flagellar motor switch protein [Candidatus Hydrogenedentes bacterium]|nr:FliM/FliN family flagellar motor switch protein [Candidatus Hydrogenedentota bacterium]HOS02457.1 FliM/FliN family flagellar motor switch protein [Candidatus Hydrogenedentota bacterium]
MAAPNPPEPVNHEFPEMQLGAGAAPADHLVLEDMSKVRLGITASLGHTSMLVRDILDLKIGSVVPLDKLAGEMTDIYLNDLPLARGEVVVIGDSLHVRIGEIIGAAEKMEEDEEEA